MKTLGQRYIWNMGVALHTFGIDWLLTLSAKCATDNDSNIKVMITWFIWTSISAIRRKAIKCNISLTQAWDVFIDFVLLWCHNEHDCISNHRHLDCFPNRLFRGRSKKTSKLCVIGLREGDPPVTGGFPLQRASNAENVSILWYHHGYLEYYKSVISSLVI